MRHTFYCICLGLLVFCLCVDFIAPYAADTYYPEAASTPPMPVHVWYQRHWLGPYVLNQNHQPVRLCLFAKGSSYRFLGCIPCQRHLFSTANGTTMVALLGCDSFGRDILSQLLLGGRFSLFVASSSALLATFLALSLGMWAALWGGLRDRIIQIVCESLQSLPRILLLLILAGKMSAGMPPALRAISLVLILGGLGWTNSSKVLRSITYRLCQTQGILAARSFGAAPWDIAIHHLIPALRPYALVVFVNILPLMFFAEGTLSFLGLGLLEPQSSWGVMLSHAKSVSTVIRMPWLFSPGVVLIATCLFFSFWGKRLQKNVQGANACQL